MNSYFLKFIFLTGTFHLAGLFFPLPSLGLSMDRVFFLNDIYHVVGKPYPSPPFGVIDSISQKFTSQCNNLNRIILPLYLDEIRPNLKFSLRELEPNSKKLFEKVIQTHDLPLPSKVARQEFKAILYSIWFPLLENSKNKTYLWELSAKSLSGNTKVGLYLTRSPSPQLTSLKINGIPRKDFAAFYSYCSYQLDVGKILSSTINRLQREQSFLYSYFTLLATICFYLVRKRKKILWNYGKTKK